MTKKEKEILETFVRIEKCFDKMDQSMTRMQYALMGIYTSVVGLLILDMVILH